MCFLRIDGPQPAEIVLQPSSPASDSIRLFLKFPSKSNLFMPYTEVTGAA